MFILQQSNKHGMNKNHAVIEIEVLYVILFVCNCWIVQSRSKHDSNNETNIYCINEICINY